MTYIEKLITESKKTSLSFTQEIKNVIASLNRHKQRALENIKSHSYNTSPNIMKMILCVMTLTFAMSQLVACDQLEFNNTTPITKAPVAETASPDTTTEYTNQETILDESSNDVSTAQQIETQTPITDISGPIDNYTGQPDTIEPENGTKMSPAPSTTKATPATTHTENTEQVLEPVENVVNTFYNLIRSSLGEKLTAFYNQYNVSDTSRLHNTKLKSITADNGQLLLTILGSTKASKSYIAIIVIDGNASNVNETLNDIKSNGQNTINIRQLASRTNELIASGTISSYTVNHIVSLTNDATVFYSTSKPKIENGAYIYSYYTLTFDDNHFTQKLTKNNLNEYSLLSTTDLDNKILNGNSNEYLK